MLETVESLQEKFGPYIIDITCKFLKQYYDIVTKIGSADRWKAINPDGPVENYPKRILQDKQPLTALRHIMDQTFSKDRLDQAKDKDTAVLKQKLADYKQGTIWIVEDIKDKKLVFLLEKNLQAENPCHCCVHI